MPTYRYTAVDMQGQNTSGLAEFPDKNSLVQWLTQKQLSLISWHEVPTVETEPPDETNDPVQGPEPSRNSTYEKKEDGFEMPELGFSQYAIMAAVFLICVFLGYLIGR